MNIQNRKVLRIKRKNLISPGGQVKRNNINLKTPISKNINSKLKMPYFDRFFLSLFLPERKSPRTF